MISGRSESSAARASTATSLRTGAVRSGFWLLLAAALALAAGCGRKSSDPQTLRTCADRWNQANMLGWGPAPASVAIRRPDARERRQLGGLKPGGPRCLVLLAA